MRVAGLSVVGIITATLVFYVFEYFWFGVAMLNAWQTGNGVSAADFEGSSPAWMAVGILAPLLQVIALAFFLKWSGWPALGESVFKMLLLAILIGGGFSLYTLVYMPLHSMPLYLINFAHIVIGWTLVAIVLTFLRPKYYAPVKHVQHAEYQRQEEDPDDIYK